MSKKPELKPLSSSEAEEFERARISQVVVQNKCLACGAWYETQRRPFEFTEAFNCDCGNPMSFTVPPQEFPAALLKPSNEAVIAIGSDLRLDTGMKVDEAMRRARQWWETKGRKEMQTQLKRQAKPVGGADHGAGTPFVTDNPDDPNFLPSAILKGHAWDALSRRERMMLIKAWHHFFIRKPDLIGDDPRITHKMQQRDTIQ